jgi:hypothetical protein
MDFTGWVLTNILVTLCNFLCSGNYCPDLSGVMWYNWFWVAVNDSGWWECPNSSPNWGPYYAPLPVKWICSWNSGFVGTKIQLSYHTHVTVCFRTTLTWALPNTGAYVSYQWHLEVDAVTGGKWGEAAKLAVEKDGLDLGQHSWVHLKTDQGIVWSKTFLVVQTFWGRSLWQRFCTSLKCELVALTSLSFFVKELDEPECCLFTVYSMVCIWSSVHVWKSSALLT